MSTEQAIPTTEVSEEMLEDNLRLLLRDLCAFANRDPYFRKGQSDYTAIEAVSGDQVLPVWEGDAENKAGKLVPFSDYTYKFAAERKRYYDDEFRQRAWVRFVFSVAGRHNNTLLPGHIAEEALGLPADEAVREQGPVTLLREQQYTFLSRDFSFGICDSYAYLDEDDDPISEACTCNEQDVIYVANAATIEEVEHSLALSRDDTIQQYATQDVEERSTHESITLIDVDQALEEWASSIDIGNHMDQEWQLGQIYDARFVLESINEAILIKLGLKQPKD
jgi:hypothetical protein